MGEEQHLVHASLVGATDEVEFCLANSNLEIQRCWFESDEFLRVDWSSDPRITAWKAAMDECQVGCAFFNWLHPTPRCFSLPVLPEMHPLFRWQASKQFWLETRLSPILSGRGIEKALASNDDLDAAEFVEK